MRVGKFALIVPVITSTDGRCVAMIRVNPGGTGHLRQTLNCRLDLLAGDQHQIGHLVDHDHDQRQLAGVEGLRLEDRLTGLRIEAGLDVADQAFAFGLAPRPGAH